MGHDDRRYGRLGLVRLWLVCIGIVLATTLLLVPLVVSTTDGTMESIAGDIVDASHPYLQVSHGRFVRNATEVRFAWVGSRVHFRFHNSSTVTVVLRSHAAFHVHVDDSVTLLQCNASLPTPYKVASELDPSVSHNVTLVLRSESKVSLPVHVPLHETPTVFARFELDPGARILPVAETPPSSKLLIVGDSISTGWGNTGTCCGQPGGRSEPCAMDATRSYGALAADELGMEVQIIALGGSGWGSVNKVGVSLDGPPMNKQFFQALPFDDASPANLSAYVPDVVVFNVGTNDHLVPLAEWTRLYVSVLRALRNAWPHAHGSRARPWSSGGGPCGGAHALWRSVGADPWARLWHRGGCERMLWTPLHARAPSDGQDARRRGVAIGRHVRQHELAYHREHLTGCRGSVCIRVRGCIHFVTNSMPGMLALWHAPSPRPPWRQGHMSCVITSW